MCAKHSCSSSSSSSSSVKKKKKKDKKAKKKDKKAEKQENKQKQRAERAKTWQCDRGEIVRLIKHIIALDPGDDPATQMGAIFDALDAGEALHLDGLQDQRARKKLRHLMQAMRLVPLDGGVGFKSADRRVSFSALFATCLELARGSPGCSSVAVASTVKSNGTKTKGVDDHPHSGPADGVAHVADRQAGLLDPKPPFHESAEDEDALEADKVSAQSDPMPGPRKVGPQLPCPGVGSTGAGDSSSDDADSGAEDGSAGPRLEGDEREGVDLNGLPEASRREEWMNMPHASVAGMFADAPGVKNERFGIKRSPEEQAAFEKMVKARGPSLLQQQMEGEFKDHAQDQESVRKRKNPTATSDAWGMSAKEQDRHAAGKVAPPSRKEFDPEKDYSNSKGIVYTSWSTSSHYWVFGLRFGCKQVCAIAKS